MTKRNPISVPDGYFQNLEQRLQQIPSREMPSATPHGVHRLAPYVAYASSLVVLVTIGNFIFRTRNGQISVYYKPVRGRSISVPMPVQLREIMTYLNLEPVNSKTAKR